MRCMKGQIKIERRISTSLTFIKLKVAVLAYISVNVNCKNKLQTKSMTVIKSVVDNCVVYFYLELDNLLSASRLSKVNTKKKYTRETRVDLNVEQKRLFDGHIKALLFSEKRRLIIKSKIFSLPPRPQQFNFLHNLHLQHYAM